MARHAIFFFVGEERLHDEQKEANLDTWLKINKKKKKSLFVQERKEKKKGKKNRRQRRKKKKDKINYLREGSRRSRLS